MLRGGPLFLLGGLQTRCQLSVCGSLLLLWCTPDFKRGALRVCCSGCTCEEPGLENGAVEVLSPAPHMILMGCNTQMLLGRRAVGKGGWRAQLSPTAVPFNPNEPSASLHLTGGNI